MIVSTLPYVTQHTFQTGYCVGMEPRSVNGVWEQVVENEVFQFEVTLLQVADDLFKAPLRELAVDDIVAETWREFLEANAVDGMWTRQLVRIEGSLRTITMEWVARQAWDDMDVIHN